MAQQILKHAALVTQMLNKTVENRIASILMPYLSSLLPLNEPLGPQCHSTLHHHHNIPTQNFNVSMLLSKRRQGDRMTSEYVNEENLGYWQRSDRDIKNDIIIDFEAECPTWMRARKGKEWRPAIPRFIEGVIVELTTRKPIKPNSGNRKIAKVQVKIAGQSRVVSARIPGENNTLQLHHRVLVQWGRARNLPHVKFVIVRGYLDAQY